MKRDRRTTFNGTTAEVVAALSMSAPDRLPATFGQAVRDKADFDSPDVQESFKGEEALIKAEQERLAEHPWAGTYDFGDGTGTTGIGESKATVRAYLMSHDNIPRLGWRVARGSKGERSTMRPYRKRDIQYTGRAEAPE